MIDRIKAPYLCLLCHMSKKKQDRMQQWTLCKNDAKYEKKKNNRVLCYMMCKQGGDNESFVPEEKGKEERSKLTIKTLTKKKNIWLRMTSMAYRDMQVWPYCASERQKTCKETTI